MGCENCLRRRLFERRLRIDNGLGIHNEVELPTIVPEDIGREDGEGLSSSAWVGTSEFDDQEPGTFQT